MEEVQTLSPAQLDSEKRFLVQITFGQSWYLTFSLKVTTCSTTCCRTCKLLCLFYFIYRGRNISLALRVPKCRGMPPASVCACVSTCLSIHLEIIMGDISWSGNIRGLICDPAVIQLYQCHRDGADLYQCGVREQSLLAPRAAGMVKKPAWGFSPLLLQVSAVDYFSLLPLILVGHGCGSHWGFA